MKKMSASTPVSTGVLRLYCHLSPTFGTQTSPPPGVGAGGAGAEGSGVSGVGSGVEGSEGTGDGVVGGVGVGGVGVGGVGAGTSVKPTTSSQSRSLEESLQLHRGAPSSKFWEKRCFFVEPKQWCGKGREGNSNGGLGV